MWSLECTQMDNCAKTLRNLDIEDAFEVARSIGWLSQQTPEFQNALLAKAKLRAFAKDKHLYRIEDESTELFCVVRGVVAVSVAHPSLGLVNGHVLLPGDWFGEAATLAKGLRMVTMQARAPTQVPAFGRKAIEDLVQTTPHFL